MTDGDAGAVWAGAAAAAIRPVLAAAGDPSRAEGQAGYMRDQFPFLGARMPQVEAAWRQVRAAVVEAHGPPSGDDLVAFATAMWDLTEREYQYAGAKALAMASRRRDLGGLAARHLEPVRDLLTTKSWWDTVDILAPNVVGGLARAHPDDVVPVLDRWVEHDNIWLVRSALLHQLRWKEATDADRLARYCLLAAPSTEFFVRKAIGWALRSHSYVDPDWVEAFVVAHEDELSGLSRREAMKVIERSRT
jgi:3-methyladenine DNA glycosylase AlkD